MKYLNSIGITRFWNNIKSYIVSQIPTKVSELDNDSNYLTSVPDHDASKITSGTIDIARLPQGALERLAIVADESARFALTSSNVQVGDVVKQSDTGLMYMVVDESNLNNSAGYVEFTAGTATSVPWSGITDKPTNFVTTDTTQTISGAKTFSNENKFKQSITIEGHSGIYWDRKSYTAGTLPDSTVYYGFQNAYESGGSVFDRIRSYISTSGTNLSEHIKYAWNDLTKYASVSFWVSADGSDSEYKYNTARVIPATTNTTNLGTSSYQWGAVHAKNYYYNGTIWGLDQVNEWSNINRFLNSITLKNTELEIGVAPSTSHKSRTFYFTDKNNNDLANIIARTNPSGSSYLSLVAGNRYKDGVMDSTGSSVKGGFYVGTTAEGKPFCDASGDLFPEYNNIYTLGTSTSQWNKTYSKEYYYNGTAWGLDQNNIWSGSNQFSKRSEPSIVSSVTDCNVAFTGLFNTIFFNTRGSSNYPTYGTFLYAGYSNDNAPERYGQIQLLRSTDKRGDTNDGFVPDTTFKMWRIATHYLIMDFMEAVRVQNDGTYNYFAPITNNATDLGLSTNQWNKIYSKEYYYNGTEFQNKFVTLDTAQTITGSKDFTLNSFVTARGYRFRIKNDSMVLGTVPSSNQWTGIQFIDKNDTPISEIVQSFQSNGNSLYQINVFPNESNSEKRSLLAYTYNSTNSANHVAFSSHLKPQSTNTYNFGDASRQWLDTYTQNLFLNGEKYTSIPLGNAGDDLNNCFLTSCGIAKYYAGTFALANNVANLPNAGIPFAMKSETVRYISNSDKIIHQRIIQNGIEYTRDCSGTAWSSWVSQYALKTGSASTGGTVTNTYFKIASFEVGVNRYFGAILQVQDLCYTQKQAVITINIRTNVDGTFQVGRLYLHNSSEISPENFILCYKEDTDKVLCELYYYQTYAWEGIRFSVLSETMYGSTLFDIMIVYNAVQSDAVASLPTGYTTIQSTFMPLSEDLIPTSNNLYTLGSSTNQWNKIYSKAYYYNGTQWGLDKANVWSNEQTILQSTLAQFKLKNSNIAIGDEVPSSTKTLGSLAFTGSDGFNLGFMDLRDSALGNTFVRILARQKYDVNGNRSNNGTTYESGIDIGVLNNTTPVVVPTSNGVAHLGISTAKWKTLNGINPGALSLPDYNSTAKVDISGSITPDAYGNIRYTPTINGWLYVCFNVSNATTNDPVFYAQAKDSNVANANFVQTFFHPTSFGSDLSVFFPVTANKEFIIQINFTGHSITKAHIIPCLGNV